MSETLEFAALVKQEPLTEKPSGKHPCPHCGGRKFSSRGQWTTLIGGGDGTVDGDPNHRHGERTCLGCDKTHVLHLQSGRVWYTTVESHVLKGWFYCFERCTYDCRLCGGTVERHYRKLDGVTPHTSMSLSYSFTDGPGQRTYWICAKCQAEAETTKGPV